MSLFKPKADESRCAFCGEPREKCRRLVAGPRVSICDRCALLATAISNDEASVLSALLTNGTASKPTAVRWALTQALAECARGAHFSEAIDALATARDERCVRQLLSRTGRQLWRPNDWATFSWAAAGLEDFESGADAACTGLEFAGSDQRLRCILWNNRIWCECHQMPPPSSEVLTSHLDEMRRVRDFWEAEVDTHPEDASAPRLLSFAHGTTAKLFAVMGDNEQALRHLHAAANTSAGVQPRALLLWGDLLAKQGQAALATQKWREARKKGQPEPGSTLEAALRSRLSG